jgi:hypothetical protein
MTKRKPPPQVVGGVRIISTVWKPVDDPKEAIKEANANRLARAMFDQAMTTTDPVIRHAMLKPVADDGTAGAALLRFATAILGAKRHEQALQAYNQTRQRDRGTRDKSLRALVDQIRAKNPRLTKTSAAKLASKQLTKQGKKVSFRTISRALDRRERP